jgi:hypothetical protein
LSYAVTEPCLHLIKLLIRFAITMETKEESTTNVDNVECQSYHKQGFCMKGANCQRTHASEAVTVPEYEFFSKWQVNVAVWKCMP